MSNKTYDVILPSMAVDYVECVQAARLDRIEAQETIDAWKDELRVIDNDLHHLQTPQRVDSVIDDIANGPNDLSSCELLAIREEIRKQLG